MNFLIYGAGAIGCLYGSWLARAGEDVTFVARGDKLRHLQNEGISIHSALGDFIQTVQAVSPAQLKIINKWDVIVLAVKSTAIDEIISNLADAVSEKTKIVCLLNGLGNEEKLAARFGADKVIGAVANVSVSMNNYGHVMHLSGGNIGIGWSNPGDPFISSVVRAFERTGVNVLLVNDVRTLKWTKLLWNIIYNPVTALAEATVGKALENQELLWIMQQIRQEYLSLAQLADISMQEMLVKAETVLNPPEASRNHKTSMLQDFENGRAMELDAIMGYVIEFANKKHHPIPIINTIYCLLSYKQATRNISMKKS